ncbi:MAG: NfeD family protein [Polaromonas sp.]
MNESTVWWLLAGLSVAAELVTGTFYLLMLAVGFSAGALASHFGLTPVGQMLTAAAVGGGAVALWHWQRRQGQPVMAASANPDVHLDIGQSVHVAHWNADGTASVHFRGAHWTAVAADPSQPGMPGNFRIKEMQGSRLVIEKL